MPNTFTYNYDIDNRCRVAEENIPQLSTISAKKSMEIFGIRWDFEIKSFTVPPIPFLNIVLPIRSMILSFTRNGNNKAFISIYENTSSNGKRQIEQQVNTCPPFMFSVLSIGDEIDDSINSARGILRKINSAVEVLVDLSRTYIVSSLSSSFRNKSREAILTKYSDKTEKEINSFLSDLHWKALLYPWGLESKDFFTVLESASLINKPRMLSITDDSNIEIEDDILSSIAFSTPASAKIDSGKINLLHSIDVANHEMIAKHKEAQWARARDKALALFRSICGEEMYSDYMNIGFATVKQNGYTFLLRDAWPKVIDPNGKTAELCIHSMRFSCHPVDEMLLHYLHIKKDFFTFMDTAIYHRKDVGFTHPQSPPRQG